ncbi:alpha/beta fold hydrolase [Rugosimonospora africana]|uniref:Alpha/beta hydrolase n=1 Tax=Rugosimonospora africana TaxID=556532 RepID=A0A8J3QRX4_9ACTN|nr:alpha/beta hydrolase [Rugosimonospora africana]GIH16380.1 alpha/beta hydrolase [Rugosimonospora africana]
MTSVTSTDGTIIDYDRSGDGPPLILVDGAFCSRSFGPMPALAPLLTKHFMVYLYDRRGRGRSGNTQPYAVEREIDDIEALIDAAGGSAHLYGVSSGAVLAMRATAALPGKVRRLAVYEPPLVVDKSRPLPPADYRQRVDDMLANGRNGDVVKFFMTKVVNGPAFLGVIMPLMPVWSKLKAVAPTLPYDLAILGDVMRGEPIPEEYRKVLANIDVPTLVGDGGKSPAWMHNGVQAVADAIGQTRRITLPGQTHQVKAGAIAPALIDFFTAEAI